MPLRLAAVAVLAVVLAGCVGAIAPGASNGTVAFYLSDETGSIEDFEHLNVTVTKVGFKRAGMCGGDGMHRGSNGMHRGGDGCHGGCQGCDDGNRTRWVVRDIPDRTVDLTRLQGKNATRLDALDVPNGTYKRVFVHVSSVSGTLENGTNVTVRLPSDRLKIKERFTIGNGERVSFVFDVSVFRRDDGTYVLRPVVSASGEDVAYTPCGCGMASDGGQHHRHGNETTTA